MKDKLLIICGILLLCFLSGCILQDESESNNENVDEICNAIPELGSVYEDDSENKYVTASKILWMTEEELRLQRIQFYGKELNYMEEYDNYEKEDVSCHYYRKDNKIVSYVVESNYEMGITENVSSGMRISLDEVLDEDAEFWEELKSHIVKEIDNIAQDSSVFVLVDNYKEIIDKMQENTEQWYWYMNANGIVIVFREYVMRPAQLSFVLPYAEWGKYINAEYALEEGELIAEMSVNYNIQIGTALSIELKDSPNILGDGVIVVNHTEINFGKEYGDCAKVYIMKDSGEACYIIISTLGPNQNDDGSVLVYKVSNDTIIQCGNVIENAILADIKGWESINIAKFMNALGDSRYGYAPYRLQSDGTLLLENEWFQINDILVVDENELPVIINGENIYLPVGTEIKLTETNNDGIVKFIIIDTREQGEIYYELNANGTCNINGIRDENYFLYGLPYYK